MLSEAVVGRESESQLVHVCRIGQNLYKLLTDLRISPGYLLLQLVGITKISEGNSDTVTSCKENSSTQEKAAVMSESTQIKGKLCKDG